MASRAQYEKVLAYIELGQKEGAELLCGGAAPEAGSGYYISKGTAQPISWSKGSAGSRLTFADASGAELLVNPGTSWIIFTGSDPDNTQFT